MNREETISYLKAYLDGDTNVGNVISLREVLESAIEHLEPHLPSNLDEAAETFNREDAARMWDYEGKTEGEIVEAAFKAGAEWMAGQGQSKEGLVVDDAFINFDDGATFIDVCPTQEWPAFDIKNEEEVIVSIRKK